MKFLRRIWSWIFRLTPLRISLLIMIGFLWLYLKKDQARKDVEKGYQDVPYRSLELIEAKAFDIRFQVTHAFYPPTPSENIVVADIDDRSVAYWGWPFPRAKWGDFLLRMQEYGAKVVAFDVVFANEAEYLGLQFMRDTVAEYEKLGLDTLPPVRLRSGQKELDDYIARAEGFGEYMRAREREADQDRAFAEALAQMDTTKVVLGWYGYLSRQEVEAQPDQDFTDNAELLAPCALTLQLKGWDYKQFVRRMSRVRAVGLQTNVPALSKNTDFFGFFTAIPDRLDGTIRKTPLLTVFSLDEENPDYSNTFVYPSLALAATNIFLADDPQSKPLVTVDELWVHVNVQGRSVPSDQYGQFLINWMGPRHTFEYYSVHDIITGFKDKPEVDPHKVFKNKIVFVGSTTIGAHDMRTIPFGTAPGVEMHVNVASNILNGDGLIRPDWFTGFDLLFILSVGIVFSIVLPRLSAISGGIVTLILFLAYLATNLYFFVEKQYSFTIVFPLAEIVFIYIGITIYRYATEEREKRFIKGAFEHYLSPTVIDQLMKDPSKLHLGGERKELTAFFSDIQGFSTISEGMEPEELVPFLNEYLTEMCDLILKYDGTIDKFEGDAIIAFFGAPIDYPDHAARACLCAVEIQSRMVELRKKWIEEGKPEIHMRIGLNTGPMVVGNMGSRDRMDYTIMGDAVNLAARLESGAKQYKVYTMISQDTLAEAGDIIETRELDVTRVVGKEEPVKVYEIIGRKNEVDPERMKVVEKFTQGIGLYKSMRWDEALTAFQLALDIDPVDGPSIVYLDRCEEFRENPPPEGWDGVYVMKSK